MRLYTVHMYLLVTVKRRNGRRQDVSDTVRLAMLAESDDDARARALAWLASFDEEPDRRAIQFAQGTRDAVAVQLHVGGKLEPSGVFVYEESDGLKVLR